MTHQKQLSLPTQKTLLSLEPEDAVAQIHQAVLPRSHRLQAIRVPWNKWHKLTKALTLVLFVFLAIATAFDGKGAVPEPLLLVVGLVCLFLVGVIVLAPFVLVTTLLLNRPRERLLAQTTDALSGVLGQCQRSDTAAYLLDFLVWLEPCAAPERKRSLHAALVRLLPRVGDDALQAMLTPERRQALRLVCDRLENTELATAALLALSSVRDPATVPIAQRLCKTSLAVADAAEAFLDTVR